jgi:hypothetical protein
MLYRLGVMAEHCKADDVLHGKSGELVISGGRGDGDGLEESSGSTPMPMVEDGHHEAESSVVADPSAEQDDGLSSMLGNLSIRYMNCCLNQSWSILFHCLCSKS